MLSDERAHTHTHTHPHTHTHTHTHTHLLQMHILALPGSFFHEVLVSEARLEARQTQTHPYSGLVGVHQAVVVRPHVVTEADWFVVCL